MSTKIKRNSIKYLLLTMGLVSAMGPFVTDFYLPALPQLTKVFSTSSSAIQMSLTLCMIGLGLGQLVIGSLSDKYGRKIPLLISMIIFSISTLGCVLTRNIYVFLFCRLIQGVSGAGGIVISKSVASDLYTGQSLVRFFAMLGCVQGLAPICAPFLGGVLLSITDWQGIFYVLFGIGLFLITILLPFRESLPLEHRSSGGLSGCLSHYKRFLVNRQFMGYVCLLALTQGALFAYIGSSTFIYQQVYGLSALSFGACFGLNALGIMTGSLAASRFRTTLQALSVGKTGMVIAGFSAAVCIGFKMPLICIEAALFIMLFFTGIIFTTATALALDIEKENSGSASALIGFFQFFAGGIISPMTGIGNIMYATAIVLGLLCVAIAIVRCKPVLSKGGSDLQAAKS